MDDNREITWFAILLFLLSMALLLVLFFVESHGGDYSFKGNDILDAVNFYNNSSRFVVSANYYRNEFDINSGSVFCYLPFGTYKLVPGINFYDTKMYYEKDFYFVNIIDLLGGDYSTFSIYLGGKLLTKGYSEELSKVDPAFYRSLSRFGLDVGAIYAIKGWRFEVFGVNVNRPDFGVVESSQLPSETGLSIAGEIKLKPFFSLLPVATARWIRNKREEEIGIGVKFFNKFQIGYYNVINSSYFQGKIKISNFSVTAGQKSLPYMTQYIFNLTYEF